MRKLAALDPRRSWRDADLVVEFHGESSHQVFWDAVEPQLPQLRLAYAAVGGVVVTTTATREGETLMRSTYKMWPPRIAAVAAAAFNDGRPTAKGVGLMSFAEAVRAGSLTGLLVRALLAWPDGADGGDAAAPSCSSSAAVPSRHGERRWAGPFNCCAAALVEARRRLSSFDVVGTTERTPRYWRALAARLERGGREGSTVFSDARAVAAAMRAHGRDGWLKPAEPNGEFRAWAAASVDADTEDERQHRRALRAAAACDARIHADGMRRAGVLRSRGGSRMRLVGGDPTCPVATMMSKYSKELEWFRFQILSTTDRARFQILGTPPLSVSTPQAQLPHPVSSRVSSMSSRPPRFRVLLNSPRLRRSRPRKHSSRTRRQASRRRLGHTRRRTRHRISRTS